MYKVKVVARPDSSNATVQPPLTALNAPTNSEGQKPSQKVLQRATPHHSKTSSSCWHPMAQSREDVREPLQVGKDWPIPPTNNTATATISKSPINIEPQAQEQPNPSTTAPPNQSNADEDQIAPFAKI